MLVRIYINTYVIVYPGVFFVDSYSSDSYGHIFDKGGKVGVFLVLLFPCVIFIYDVYKLPNNKWYLIEN